MVLSLHTSTIQKNADTFMINKREAAANSFISDVTARKIIFITAEL